VNARWCTALTSAQRGGMGLLLAPLRYCTTSTAADTYGTHRPPPPPPPPARAPHDTIIDWHIVQWRIILVVWGCRGIHSCIRILSQFGGGPSLWEGDFVVLGLGLWLVSVLYGVLCSRTGELNGTHSAGSVMFAPEPLQCAWCCLRVKEDGALVSIVFSFQFNGSIDGPRACPPFPFATHQPCVRGCAERVAQYNVAAWVPPSF